MYWSDVIVPLIIGFTLDSFLGDPAWLPHPIKYFGKTISIFEGRMNNGNRRKSKGTMLVVLLVLTVCFFTQVLVYLSSFNKIASVIFLSLGVYVFLANRSLIYESWLVIRRLKNIDDARIQLSRIVGRDTCKLTEQQIRTAVLETMAENLSDAVVAPLFWFGVGGLPAMAAYKMVNTLDSMVGYKSERFRDFGWAAARLDDVANFIPARLTAILIALISLNIRSMYFIMKYGNKHASPNSGYPEAAMAGVLNCRFGGPNVYHGQLVEKPYVGCNNRQLNDNDFWETAIINCMVTIVTIALIIGGKIMFAA